MSVCVWSKVGMLAGRSRRALRGRRKGVASVLSMMFLIMFGSLAAAMAIVSQGNIRTASAHLHVMRAMGAAETGLAVARARLEESTSRFIVEKGRIDADYAEELWSGSFSVGDGNVLVVDPPSGFDEAALPGGIAEALANMHAADSNTIEINGIDAPTIGAAAADAGAAYADDDWVYTPAVRLNSDDDDPYPTAFQVTYAPLANGTDVRVIVTGYDFAHQRGGVPLSRTMTQDFRIAKRVESAILAPSKIMIGKNVMIDGDLGAVYTAVDAERGHPLQLRSDFRGLDDSLDDKLDALEKGLDAYDVDGDNRLRVDHPIESQGLISEGEDLNDKDYDGDGDADNAFADASGDGYLDEFDIFIRHYDRDGDGRLVLSEELTDGTPAEGKEPEFVDGDGECVDADLALLIDSSNPDRNRNGIYGYLDTNHDGTWDPGEAFLDYDSEDERYRDQVLGYRDGYLDRKDLYAKVGGKLIFRVTDDAWEEGQGDYAGELRGAILPDEGDPARIYNASDEQIPTLTEDDFADGQNALEDAANGDSFASQVAEQLGVSTDALPTYVQGEGGDADAARYYRLDADADADGLPDNWESAYFEKMPFNSPTYSDWYYRPVYENMTFHDCRIPMGTNALFRNCTFVGVTWIETYSENTNANWNLYGKMKMPAGETRPKPDPERWCYGDEVDEDEDDAPPSLPESAIPPTALVRIAEPPIDKGDIVADLVGTIENYDELPDPLVIDGVRVTDSKLWSNNIRFHDCLFVGSLASNTPGQFTTVRNKLQFTGATRFVDQHPDYPDDPEYNPESGDLAVIETSSLMVPNYSVDLGSFNSPPEQDLQLHGAIIAGVIDIRGNTTITGALLLTYQPQLGVVPLADYQGNAVGNPSDFNTTLGYFGPEDGDQESLNPNDLPEIDGVKIVGWDLDGDGLADLGPDDTPTDEQIAAGAAAVPFHGYGRIQINFNPNMVMPDGIMLPLRVDARSESYSEGSPW